MNRKRSILATALGILSFCFSLYALSSVKKRQASRKKRRDITLNVFSKEPATQRAQRGAGTTLDVFKKEEAVKQTALRAKVKQAFPQKTPPTSETSTIMQVSVPASTETSPFHLESPTTTLSPVSPPPMVPETSATTSALEDFPEGGLDIVINESDEGSGNVNPILTTPQIPLAATNKGSQRGTALLGLSLLAGGATALYFREKIAGLIAKYRTPHEEDSETSPDSEISTDQKSADASGA